MKCRRSPGLASGSASTPGWAGKETSVAPCQRSSAGRTSNRKVTSAETGLPGRPNNSFPRQRPNTNGRPGLIATFQNSKLAADLLERALDEIHFANRNAAGSHDRIALVESVRQRQAGRGERIRDEGKDFGDRPGALQSAPPSASAIAFVNPAGRQRLPGLLQFRTGGQQTHHRLPPHADARQTGRSQQADSAGG